MPQDAIEVVSATYAAWNAGDWGLERIHPQVEWELIGNVALDQATPTVDSTIGISNACR